MVNWLEKYTSGFGDIKRCILHSRIRDMKIRQNLSPLRQSLTKAVSVGGSNISRAVSSGGIRLMRGVDALWGEFEKGMHEDPEHNSSDSVSEKSTATTTSLPGMPLAEKKMIDLNQSAHDTMTDDQNKGRQGYPPAAQPRKTPASESSTDLSPFLESTSQQAGRLFTNVSSFLTRKQKEIAKAMEVNLKKETEPSYL